jgi:SnoaL-like domain
VAIDALQRLIAIEEIKHLKARYFRYVDQQDWDALRLLFWEDAHLETGVGDFGGVEPFITTLRGYLADGRTFHLGHMPEIDILSETEASGIWTLLDRVEVPADRARPSFYGYARYWDLYRYRQDEWRIASLRIERLLQTPLL